MLHQHHGNPPRLTHVENKAGEIFLLLCVHACHRLVHQQDGGLLRQRAAKIDALAQAVAEAADRLVADRLDFKQLDDFLDDFAVAHLLAPARAEIEKRRRDRTFHVNVTADHDVFDHGHIREDVRALEGSRQTGAHDIMDPHAGDHRTIEAHFTLLRPIEPAEA
ncbi:MAG: hypothetical protein J0H75_03875, partial [Rhizobiales bacterium]|nr:hypothetical protein [Hyphomicrobiales bacterium]